jgi:hypothetical protein
MKESQVADKNDDSAETFGETEIETRRERILKQLLGGEPTTQRDIAKRAKQRRQSR